MYRQLPYKISYNTVAIWRKLENGLLWSTFACSILLLIFQNNPVCQLLVLMTCIVPIINILNYISIFGYGLLYIIVEIIMQPMVASERRKGFLDNSLGTELLAMPVQNYYDNDSIKHGPYKMLVNCFENCFFTHRIVNAMLPKVISKNMLLSMLLLFFAYDGFKNNILAIPFLQLLLSPLFLIELLYHISFLLRMNNLYEQFRQIFSMSQSNKKRITEQAFYMVLEYETTLAYNKSPNSNAVYKKLRKRLTDEWNSIKEKYDIR